MEMLDLKDEDGSVSQAVTCDDGDLQKHTHTLSSMQELQPNAAHSVGQRHFKRTFHLVVCVD